MFGKKKRGKFIVIEGADGTGTTTHVRMMISALRKEMGANMVESTFEPSQWSIGRLLRRILTKEVERPPGKSMELLFRADRLEHIRNVIEPWLDSGHWVICDRYYPSTLVYQGMGDTLESSFVNMCHMYHRFISEDHVLLPDLTIFLDADPDMCQERMGGREKSAEIYEGYEFQVKVRDLYLKWANGNRDIVVDASKDKESVHMECMRIAKELI